MASAREARRVTVQYVPAGLLGSLYLLVLNFPSTSKAGAQTLALQISFVDVSLLQHT